MNKSFNRYDVLTLAVVAAVVVFCVQYARVDARVEGSALTHMLDQVLSLLGKV